MSLDYGRSESAKTRLRLAIEHNFKKITQSEGYRHDMGDFYHRYVEPTTIANRPAVVLISGPSTTLNEDMSDGLLHKQINYSGLAYLHENEDDNKSREEFLCDIETMIGRNFTLPGEDGVETCLLCQVSGDEPFGMVANKPQICFAFGLKVIMRQLDDDATVLG
jgi:hypothetical protein